MGFDSAPVFDHKTLDVSLQLSYGETVAAATLQLLIEKQRPAKNSGRLEMHSSTAVTQLPAGTFLQR
jgi:hypothetical protein